MGKVVGFIGGGVMTEALLKGGLEAGVLSKDSVLVSTPRKERQLYFEKRYGVKSFFDNRRLVRESQIVVLATKPQVLPGVLEEVKDEVRASSPLVISVAAGISTSFMERFLGSETRIVRTMPNTPVTVRSGVTAVCGNASVTDEDLEEVKRLFSGVGEVVEVSEELFEAVTAISGSGPAYVFLFMEALVEAGVRQGLSRALSEFLVVETVLGAARLAKETKKTPYELRAMVTSPAGTTSYALKELYKGGFYGAVQEAVDAASKRAKDLGKD